jgi:hypothetical protein
VLELAISSRAFSSGFDIKTPRGLFSAKRVPLSPTGEIQILIPSDSQIARLERESFFSSVYNVILSGGGFYQFARDKTSSRTWTCRGEGKRAAVSFFSLRMPGTLQNAPNRDSSTTMKSECSMTQT